MADAADKTADDPLLGQDLGGYEIQKLIGRGGYANVYLAVQKKLEREVALKVLREDGTGVDPRQVEAFWREAKAAASFNHSCLVQVFDVGESSGRNFLSMELVRGGNLARRIRKEGPLPWRDAILIAMDVAEALQCAHDHGLLHHDVKPANILLTRNGEAKLADLGLAMSMENAGTRAFMAPERILRKEVDERSDLYSLGCTLFAMLTGVPPFHSKSSKEMLAAHVNDAPPKLASLGVEVPDELQKLVSRLLAKDPGQRPETATKTADLLEMVDDVAATAAPAPAQPERVERPERAGESTRVETQPSAVARPVRRRARRRSNESDVPWGTVIALAFVALAVLGGLWAWRAMA